MSIPIDSDMYGLYNWCRTQRKLALRNTRCRQLLQCEWRRPIRANAQKSSASNLGGFPIAALRILNILFLSLHKSGFGFFDN